MKNQYFAQMQISRQIHKLEDDIDTLMADAGELIALVTKFRIEKNLDANIGQRPISRLAEIQTALVTARSKTIGAHSDMRKIMEERADFPVTCPESERGHLTEVQAA